MSGEQAETPATTARSLLRGLDRATLATSQDGWPYASLVLTAVDHDASPLLLLSNLAEHTKNIKRSPRGSLLFDGTAGLDDPLTGPRVTVIGEVRQVDEPRLLARFIARHPAAEAYVGFADFSLYRLRPVRAHLVAGFGRIDWIDAEALLSAPAPALAAAEANILAHLNADHADTVNLFASRLLGLTGDGWRLTGIDSEGVDLRRGGSIARLDFHAPVGDAEGIRAELTCLAKLARRQA